jgi:oxygen-independent coproporphyrinogen-3 oxidase
MIVLPQQKSRIGFYFHIPFCPHICPYCDFVKTAQFSKKDVELFFIEINNQLISFINKLDKNATKKYATVYFGGGTPGLFEASFYKSLLEEIEKYFHREETTLETNPATNIKRKFFDYFSLGFDRITLGAQSLCPNTLKFLGRKHTPQCVLENITWAKEAGFQNIQVDLIYGLKAGTRTLSIDKEIEELYSAGATGISAYCLSLEQNTFFANTNFASDLIAENEYKIILKKCIEIDFFQQETSNFSRYLTKHNNLYWYGFPYIGIGTGAHGLLPASQKYPYGQRYHVGNPQNKFHFPGNHKLNFHDHFELKKNFSISYENPRTKKEYVEEMFFTLLRTPNGIPFSWLKHCSEDENILNIMMKNEKIDRALNEKKILLLENSLALSPEEKIRGDAWVIEFLRMMN